MRSLRAASQSVEIKCPLTGSAIFASSSAAEVPAADQAMKAGKWEKKRFLGNELRGKTLGIAGLGRIGQEVASRARAFGMRIVAHDPYISREIADGIGAELLPFDDVCAVADYLTLHLPSTPSGPVFVKARAVPDRKYSSAT